MRMSIITLTTDFGTTDYRVASIKGEILSAKNTIPIIDITHQIAPYNLMQTAYIIRNAYSHFPKGSIHIVCVDSFYHLDRKFLLIKSDDHYFIMADNGLFSLIFPNTNPEQVYEITPKTKKNNINFTPIDIFVPAAISIQKDDNLDKIGKKITDIKQVIFPKTDFNETQKILIGEIIYIDHYGNAISNIDKTIFEEYKSNFERFTIKFREFKSKKIIQKYTDIITNWDEEYRFYGNTITLFNESNLLEIAMYKGNIYNGAFSLMGLNIGEKVFVEFE